MKTSGRMIVGVCAVATGIWSISPVAAFQVAIGGGKVAATDNPDARKGDASELKGQTSAEPQTAVDDGGDVIGVVSVTPVVPTAPVSTNPRRSGVAVASEFSRRSEREAERRLNEIMEEERNPEPFAPGEQPLSLVLGHLAEYLNKSQGVPVLIKPDLVALEAESISSLDDVNIRDIQIPADAMTVASYLDYILGQTDPRLSWMAKDELLLITTRSAAESEENQILRSYFISRLREISKLIVAGWVPKGEMSGGGFFQVGGGGMGGGGMSPQVQQTQSSTPQTGSHDNSAQRARRIKWETGVMQVVQDMTSPPCRWFDIDGEGGHMNVAGNRLLIRQTRAGHQAIIEVLEQLEIAAEEAAE